MEGFLWLGWWSWCVWCRTADWVRCCPWRAPGLLGWGMWMPLHSSFSPSCHSLTRDSSGKAEMWFAQSLPPPSPKKIHKGGDTRSLDLGLRDHNSASSIAGKMTSRLGHCLWQAPPDLIPFETPWKYGEDLRLVRTRMCAKLALPWMFSTPSWLLTAASRLHCRHAAPHPAASSCHSSSVLTGRDCYFCSQIPSCPLYLVSSHSLRKNEMTAENVYEKWFGKNWRPWGNSRIAPNPFAHGIYTANLRLRDSLPSPVALIWFWPLSGAAAGTWRGYLWMAASGYLPSVN